jgi:hypothetical protein
MILSELGFDINFEIALNMTIDQLVFFCINNEIFKEVCKCDNFWLRYLQFDYPKLISYKPIDLNYGQYYYYLKNETIKVIDVGYNCKIVGSIPMFKTDTINDVNMRSINLVSNMGITLDTNNTFIENMSFVCDCDIDNDKIWEYCLIDYYLFKEVVQKSSESYKNSVNYNYGGEDINDQYYFERTFF